MGSHETVRNFSSGVMNKDVDERLLPDGQYVDALNIENGASSSSNMGSVQNSLGNEQISDIAAITGEFVANASTIGSTRVDALNLIYWLVASDNFDAIFELNKNTGVVSRVLQSNKSTPTTPSQLNFSKSYLVTGINYIVGSGLLTFTDNFNEPFCINVARAKGYSVDDPRIDEDIRLIKEPPLYSPYITMVNDGSQANNMSEKFLYFSYRYKYIDNQYSSLSPFTPSAFIPGSYSFDPQKGYNAAMVNNINAVDITIETGGQFVTDIQVIMLDSTSKNVFIVETLNKSELGLSNNVSYKFDAFSNNKTYTALSSDQIGRLFDNVPLKAQAQDLVGSRLVFGDYVQFQDIVDESGKDILIDYSVSYRNDLATPTEASPKQTFRSDRDLELSLFYLDNYGRMTTALTSLNNTVYIKPEDAKAANSLVLSINNKAPNWATGWRIGIKQSRDAYYNLFPILFYKDGNYRYFLLNESDRDKVSTGDYVIFKAGPEGITNSNKQYKVLEVALKQAGFISGGISEFAGLYFKIKVDSASEFSPSSLFNYNSTGDGANSTNDGVFNVGEITAPPIINDFKVAENPIFYGTGNGAVLTVSNSNQYSGVNDLRYTIEIQSTTTFRYTTNLDGSAPYIQDNVAIVAGSDIDILLPGSNVVAFKIQFSTTSGFVVGDKWKVNCRGSVFPFSANQNYFGGIGISKMSVTQIAGLVGGYAIVPGVLWSPNNAVEVDRPINVGAIITMEIIEDKYNPNPQSGTQQFPPSDRNYVNLEEWFVESGAYQLFDQIDLNGNNVGSSRISFRRGKTYQLVSGLSAGADLTNQVDQGSSANSTTLAYPVRMFIAGCGTDDGPNNQNHIRVSFSIQQQNNSNIVETVPKQNDIDVYHEVSRTYPVDDDGNHIVNWAYDDFIFYQSSGQYNGYTALTQLNDGPPHYFEVGETITVRTSNVSINGTRQVVEVPNQHTVVINLPFPGSGPVTPGTIAHNAIDTDQGAFPNTAIVVLNNPDNQNSLYNAWSFGNGLESNRIKDDFNQTTLEYSPRVSSVIEDYKQVHNEDVLCYSGIFNETSSVNRLNEFNLSIANFKQLDKSFGAVRKLYTRDTDLLVFQQNKTSKVLFGKNLLVDAVGGGQVASVPEVLGTQIAYPYEYGIGNNPESFSAWGYDMFFASPFTGDIIRMTGDQMDAISEYGMMSYFRDLFRDGVNKRKIGSFDPFRKHYVLSANDISSIPCRLSISPSKQTVGVKALTDYFLFSISTDSNWLITIQDTGFGTGWVTNLVISGSGSYDVTADIAQNNTSLNRNLNIIVTYCGGLTQTFVLYQARGGKGKIVNQIFNNPNRNESIAKL